MKLINDELGPAKHVNYLAFTEIIDNTIDEIFIKHGISFANLSTCFTGVTCFNRNMVINKNIIILSSITHATKLSDNIIMFGGLLITFIHEFLHILRRTIIHEACNPFYERTSEQKIASRDDIYVSEGGMQLEDRLFGKILETIGYLDGKFLLHYQNWTERRFNYESKKNRWVIPSSGGIMYINYNDDKDDIETATTTTSSSSQRWDIAKCALSSPFYRIDD